MNKAEEQRAGSKGEKPPTRGAFLPLEKRSRGAFRFVPFPQQELPLINNLEIVM
jgi:hypothetical protein